MPFHWKVPLNSWISKWETKRRWNRNRNTYKKKVCTYVEMSNNLFVQLGLRFLVKMKMGKVCVCVCVWVGVLFQPNWQYEKCRFSKSIWETWNRLQGKKSRERFTNNARRCLRRREVNNFENRWKMQKRPWFVCRRRRLEQFVFHTSMHFFNKLKCNQTPHLHGEPF